MEVLGIEGTAAVYVTQVERFKSDTDTNVNIVKTTIMIDLTGLRDGGTAGDIHSVKMVMGCLHRSSN